MNKKKTILFVIEHKEREFFSKCFLAYQLVKLGFRVYMGSFLTIDAVAERIGPSIFFNKSTYWEKSKYYKELGHKFIFLDEEGGLTTPRSATKEFCQERYSTVNKGNNDIIFLPGDRFEKYVAEMTNTVGVDFFTFGWPRVDLWRKEYRFLYNSEIQNIKEKHGNYYLFITSFGMTSKETFEERLEIDIELYQKLYKHKYNAFVAYIDLLNNLSHLLKDNEKIIIRPHPSEHIQDWYKIAKKLKNVYVIRDGDISPWILASDGVIQYGSTTATQACLNGIQPIQYKIDWVEGITDTPSFELCVNADSAVEVYNLLTTNKQKYNLEVEAKAISFLKLEMAYDELELSAVKIAKTLNENSSPLISRYVPSYYSFIKPFIKYALDYLRILYYNINKIKIRFINIFLVLN
ncbi:MAG: hypothetical protein RLZZ479_1140 [Bacteroidota bacterium]